MKDDLANRIIAMLNNRKEFDWWWEGIGARNRAEIRREMRKLIAKDSAATTVAADGTTKETH